MVSLIQRFNKNRIRYLLIGGQAVRLHGFLRSTMDWDFFIPGKDAANIAAINELIGSELGESLEPLGARGEGFVQTFQTTSGILQFHLLVPGLPTFDEAEKNSLLLHDDEGTPVRCLSVSDLLAAKRASGRR